jgi:hypothetical protein
MVRVDADGLHLRAEVRDGRLYCAEVVSADSFGPGDFRWNVGSDVARLDSNLVFGLFTWSDDGGDPELARQNGAVYHREIDIELSRWGQPGNDNAQFVVQPAALPENIVRFVLPEGPASIHGFRWDRTKVSFRAETSNGSVKQAVIERHVPAGGVNARINLWSVRDRLAWDGANEVVLKNFTFTAAR